MNAQNVLDCWKIVFPNSYCHSRTILGEPSFRFIIAKNTSEVANGIIDNDPLCYVAFLRLDGKWEEGTLSLLVKPTVQYMAFDSLRLRKKTIKDITSEKLIKRFQQVRAFIMENADKLKDPKFDISTK